ncbi:MAG: hypothetical protein KatS3mg110_1436 [Pirellulaceae bacterium]|nr:MAG: hypothetical protein KatS3mg110_1436 [Pirellulaceae bacterium]
MDLAAVAASLLLLATGALAYWGAGSPTNLVPTEASHPVPPLLRMVVPPVVTPGQAVPIAVEARHGSTGEPVDVELELHLVKNEKTEWQTAFRSGPKGTALVQVPANIAGSDAMVTVRPHNTEEKYQVAARLSHPQRSYVAHLATDRWLYYPGQTVKFRAVTLDPITFQPLDQGRIQFLVRHVDTGRTFPEMPMEIPLAGGVAHGQWSIPEENDIATGDYQLIATSPDRLFQEVHRHFVVQQRMPQDWMLEAELTRPSYLPGDTARVDLAIRGAPARDRPVNISADIWTGDQHRQQLSQQMTRGQAQLTFQVPEDWSGTEPLVVQLTGEAADGRWQRVLVAPHKNETWRVRMVPEGGVLAAGLPCRLYFEVQDSLGRPVALDGQLVDQDGRRIMAVRTDPALPGCGLVAWTPQIDEHYWIESSDGKQRWEVGPITMLSETVILRVEPSVIEPAQPIRVKLYSRQAGRSLAVAVMRSGVVLGQRLVVTQSGRPSEPVEVPIELPENTAGVMRVMVFDIEREARLVASRLVFRRPSQYWIVSRTRVDPPARGVESQDQLAVADERSRPAQARAVVTIEEQSRSGAMFASLVNDLLLADGRPLLSDMESPIGLFQQPNEQLFRRLDLLLVLRDPEVTSGDRDDLSRETLAAGRVASAESLAENRGLGPESIPGATAGLLQVADNYSSVRSITSTLEMPAGTARASRIPGGWRLWPVAVAVLFMVVLLALTLWQQLSYWASGFGWVVAALVLVAGLLLPPRPAAIRTIELAAARKAPQVELRKPEGDVAAESPVHDAAAAASRVPVEQASRESFLPEPPSAPLAPATAAPRAPVPLPEQTSAGGVTQQADMASARSVQPQVIRDRMQRPELPETGDSSAAAGMQVEAFGATGYERSAWQRQWFQQQLIPVTERGDLQLTDKLFAALQPTAPLPGLAGGRGGAVRRAGPNVGEASRMQAARQAALSFDGGLWEPDRTITGGQLAYTWSVPDKVTTYQAAAMVHGQGRLGELHWQIVPVAPVGVHLELPQSPAFFTYGDYLQLSAEVRNRRPDVLQNLKAATDSPNIDMVFDPSRIDIPPGGRLMRTVKLHVDPPHKVDPESLGVPSESLLWMWPHEPGCWPVRWYWTSNDQTWDEPQLGYAVPGGFPVFVEKVFLENEEPILYLEEQAKEESWHYYIVRFYPSTAAEVLDAARWLGQQSTVPLRRWVASRLLDWTDTYQVVSPQDKRLWKNWFTDVTVSWQSLTPAERMWFQVEYTVLDGGQPDPAVVEQLLGQMEELQVNVAIRARVASLARDSRLEQLFEQLRSAQRDDGAIVPESQPGGRNPDRISLVETTATALLAWAEPAWRDRYAQERQRALTWLRRQRQWDGSFGSVHATTLALAALTTEPLITVAGAGESRTVEVTVGGASVETIPYEMGQSEPYIRVYRVKADSPLELRLVWPDEQRLEASCLTAAVRWSDKVPDTNGPYALQVQIEPQQARRNDRGELKVRLTGVADSAAVVGVALPVGVEPQWSDLPAEAQLVGRRIWLRFESPFRTPPEWVVGPDRLELSIPVRFIAAGQMSSLPSVVFPERNPPARSWAPPIRVTVNP